MNANAPPLDRPIAGIRAPDSRIAREAVELARLVSPPMLFNHVMRSYYLGRLVASEAAGGWDDEVVFLSAVLHDLGLTDHARGERRFEIEGADAARRFLTQAGLEPERGWLVWDTIALHTWQDINLFKEPEARIAQLGIVADVVGAGLDRCDAGAIEAIRRAFPRLGFKRGFVELLQSEARLKPDAHVMHPVHMIAEHCCYHVAVPDARQMIDSHPMDD